MPIANLRLGYVLCRPLGPGPSCLRFQNPERGELRDLAVTMGAAYLPDWGPSATHLIGAFGNTPKVKEAARSGHGSVVNGDWIRQCYHRPGSSSPSYPCHPEITYTPCQSDSLFIIHFMS